ncbi:hypothetical protein PVAP13_5KG603807 [Panicum virgatum]|uniref:Uncharacterized protein n=1 Tax=Panicum virgatum TaxID=38727 RepID=A0A8T0SX18_PANVG|nr:hypothetical protein PVAP13_5KG603807 [Panicum virgatum]
MQLFPGENEKNKKRDQSRPGCGYRRRAGGGREGKRDRTDSDGARAPGLAMSREHECGWVWVSARPRQANGRASVRSRSLMAREARGRVCAAVAAMCPRRVPRRGDTAVAVGSRVADGCCRGPVGREACRRGPTGRGLGAFIAALQATLPPPLTRCCTAAAHVLLRCYRRRGLHAAASPSRRLRCVQSLAGEETWPVSIQYFESKGVFSSTP